MVDTARDIGPDADEAMPDTVTALRLTAGTRLLGEYQGTGFAEPRYLVRRGDGQVIQLTGLLYLVTATIGEGDADGWDADRVAARVRAAGGREVTADNIGYLVRGKLAPLGVVRAGAENPARGGVDRAGPPPRTNLLLGLRLRGVLLPERAASAVGRGLAWLHSPPLVVLILAGLAAFEAWLFGVHGAVGGVLQVLRQPVLLLAVAGLTLASLVFHEFGHASACRYGGARPGHIGFGIYLAWLALYTDVTDAYRLDRAGRLRTDLGGVYFNAVFVLGMAACYATTGQPVFLAAAFLINFEILQQLVPIVRMDGYFVLGDLAGVPDLLGLLKPIMTSLLPGRTGRAGALRRGPRILVTVWVLVAVPLLAAMGGYGLWHLPAMVTTGAASFHAELSAAASAFTTGHPAAGLVAVVNLVVLLIPAVGLGYLTARIVGRAATMVVGLAARYCAPRRTGHHRRPRPGPRRRTRRVLPRRRV